MTDGARCLTFRMRAWIKRRWKFYAITITCLELIVIFGGCANKILLLPTTDVRNAGSARSHIVQLEGRGTEFFIDRSPACGEGEPRAFVLEFCGNGTRAEDITAWLANQRWRKLPVEIWTVNYPGYGQSTGPATLASIPGQALAAYDTLRKVAGERPIFIEANSLGSTVALYVASKRPTPGLIMQNVPPLRRLIMLRHGWWNLFLFSTPIALQVPSELNATSTAPKVTAPGLFLMSEQDTLVPPPYQTVVHEAYAGPKTVVRVPNAGHNDGVDRESEEAVRAWIKTLWDETVK